MTVLIAISDAERQHRCQCERQTSCAILWQQVAAEKLLCVDRPIRRYLKLLMCSSACTLLTRRTVRFVILRLYRWSQLQHSE